MPLYVADYLADTGHLDCAEHGAYIMLIMHYWQTGGLPNDDRKLASIARAMPEQWLSMKPTIAEFFDAGWRHGRIDAELKKSSLAYERRVNAGHKGGIATRAKEQCLSNAPALPKQSLHNTDIDPNGSILAPSARKPTHFNEICGILEGCLSPKTTLDLIAHRKAKRAPLTPRAAELLVAAFRDHGEPEQCAEAMIANGWQGFKPEWMNNKARAGPTCRSNGTQGFVESVLGDIENDKRRREESPSEIIPVLQLGRYGN
jgi:uncharacterized protein YdaU (DUF1376 family)